MKTALLSFAAAVAAASFGVAQETATEVSAQEAANAAEPHVHRASDLLGKDILNSRDVKLGELEDLVFDPESGEIVYAILAHGGLFGLGGEYYVAPWSKFSTRRDEDGEESVLLNLEEADLEGAPTFPDDAWPTLSQSWEELVHKAYNVEFSAPEGETRKLLRCSSLDNEVVLGVNDVELGDVEQIVLDPSYSRLTYYVIGTGGFLGMGEKQVAFPWLGTTIRANEDDELVMSYPVTEERLEAAPEYDPENWQGMSDPTFVGDLYVFYSVRPYWVHIQEASSDQ